MHDNFGALDASIQEKIDVDNDFQASIADLSNEEKETAVKAKKSELLDSEIKNLSEGKKKSDEVAENQKKRAEKAEKELKEKKPETPTSPDLTFKDQLAITNAKIHEDDIDEVIDYAKFKKISVSDALKSPVIKASLDEKAEVRKSAQATSTTTARRSISTPSNSEVLEKTLKKGEIPEQGSPEAEQLFKARHGIK